MPTVDELARLALLQGVLAEISLQRPHLPLIVATPALQQIVAAAVAWPVERGQIRDAAAQIIGRAEVQALLPPTGTDGEVVEWL